MKLALSSEHAAFDSLTNVKASSKKLANYNNPHILRKKMPFWKPIFFTFFKDYFFTYIGKTVYM